MYLELRSLCPNWGVSPPDPPNQGIQSYLRSGTCCALYTHSSPNRSEIWYMYLIIHVLDLRIGELPAGLLGHVVIYDAFGETKIGEISPCRRSEKVGEVISYGN